MYDPGRWPGASHPASTSSCPRSFDFFGNRDFAPLRLASSIDFMAGAQVTQQERNTLSAIVERGGAVRVSFFGLPRMPRLALPHVVPGHGLKVASLLDLAGTKAQVVQARAEAKDYVDIDAILQDGRIALPMMLASARAIYGPQFNPQITLKALSSSRTATCCACRTP